MTTVELLNAWDVKIAEMTQVRQALAAHLGLLPTAGGRKGKKSSATAEAEVPKKGRGKKDPSLPKALPNAFAAFMRDASELFPTDWEEYVAELPMNDKGTPNLQGAKMKFALLCKDSTHADEYVEYAAKHNAMVATVKASNSAAASVAASETSSVTSAKSAKSAKSSATSASAPAPLTKKAQLALEVAARKKEREEKKKAEEQAKADRKAEREAKAAAKLVAATAKKTAATTKAAAPKKAAAKASKAILIADEDEPVLMSSGYKPIGSSSSSSAAAVEEIDETPYEEEGEDVNLTPFLFGEQRMIRTDEGETWLLNEDGSRGEWAGMYDAESGTLDETAENPFEE